MVNKKFEAYKIKRELKRSGITFPFLSVTENDFGEPVVPDLTRDFDSVPESKKLLGLYHEVKSPSIQIVTGEAARTPIERVPMILCLYDDVIALGIQEGDYTKVGAAVYKVLGVANIQQWGIIADITLEVMSDGF